MSDIELLRRLLTSNEPRRMSDAAKDLGASLTNRDADQHLRALDLLHEVHGNGEFGRGFVTALRNVFDSFLATLDREASDAELSRLAEREGLREVLIALYDGHRRPSQVAQHTERAKSQVSSLLQELEACGLVERGPDTGDARVRERTLTPRGLGLARRLATHASTPVLSEVFSTVSAVLECFAALVSRQHIARADLSEILDRKLALPASVRALAALEAESQRLGLAVERDATFWHVEAHLQAVVVDHIERATDGDSDALRALLPSLGLKGRQIIIRTGKCKDAWSRLIQRRSLAGVEVLGSGEARVECPALQGDFDVIYDSGIEVRYDLASRNCQAFIEPASDRWIHTVSQSTLPEAFAFRGAPLEV